MKVSLSLLSLLALWTSAGPAGAQIICLSPPVHTCQQSRIVYKTVYEQQQVTAYRIEYETQYEQREVTTYRPVWETQIRKRYFTVQKPVTEIRMREERYVTFKPVITYKEVTVDEGCYERQEVHYPGRVYHQLAWKPPRCAVDPYTGISTYQRGALVWKPVLGAGRIEVRRVWKPKYVVHKVPQTHLEKQIVVKQVPYTVCRYVSEQRVQQYEVKVCKQVAVKSTVRVPVCVEKRIPITYICRVPRLVAFREPCPVCSIYTRVVETTRVQKKILELADDSKAKSSEEPKVSAPTEKPPELPPEEKKKSDPEKVNQDPFGADLK